MYSIHIKPGTQLVVFHMMYFLHSLHHTEIKLCRKSNVVVFTLKLSVGFFMNAPISLLHVN